MPPTKAPTFTKAPVPTEAPELTKQSSGRTGVNQRYKVGGSLIQHELLATLVGLHEDTSHSAQLS